MNPDDVDKLTNIMSSYGLNLSDFSIQPANNGFLVNPNGTNIPTYNATSNGFFPGSVPLERSYKSGASYQQARPSSGFPGMSGQTGRKINAALKEEMREVMVHCYLENFNNLIKDQTGALRESIQQGNLKEVGSQGLYQFTFTIADIPGRSRQEGYIEPNRPGTQYYGPRVFYGRAAIFTNPGRMRFRNQEGNLVSRHYVKATQPKNIFLLSRDQIERLNKVILKPITKEIREWMKQAWEGNNGS